MTEILFDTADLPEIDGLHWDRKAKDLIDIKVKPTIFWRDGELVLSAEDGHGFADYYGENHGGHPYINPEIEAWAEKKGGYWEWINPGALAFVFNK